MVKVKICGITNLVDARVAIENGADMLGFNFYPESKRYIDLENAAKIIADLGDTPVENVGVFVNADVSEIAETGARLGLDMIQLHGEEGDLYVEELRQFCNKPIIHAIRISSRSGLVDAINSIATYVLLDSCLPGHRGGTGVSFNWEIAKEAAALLPEAVFLAGGLTHNNVAEAVRRVRPFAVDVASGVESSPGKKDPDKVALFIRAAKEAI